MDEYISREAVFRVVHGIARGIATKDTEALKAKDMKTLYKVKGAKEILDSVDTDLCYIPAADVQQINRWIRCNEKLPEESKYVLIYYNTWSGNHIAIARLTNYVFAFNNSGQSITMDRVTHWQPLPEPPKDGDTNG